MKKFLCVLAAAMCGGAVLMFSACGGNSGDNGSVSDDEEITDVTDGSEENTEGTNDGEEIIEDSKEEVELIEVTLSEAYETLSAFGEKFHSAIESDSFNMIFNTDDMVTMQYSGDEENGASSDFVTSFDIDSKFLYDGEHFYGDLVQKAPDTDYYTYITYRDTQRVYKYEETERYFSDDSIEDSITSYFKSDVFIDYIDSFISILSQLQQYNETAAEYEGSYFQSTVKMYSEADYIKINLAFTESIEGYRTISAEYNIELNLSAGLTEDDFEPLSYESNSSELNPGVDLSVED